jgi:hypothetical protein
MTQTILKLNKLFYSCDAIEKTTTAYKDVALADIKNTNKYYEVILTPLKKISHSELKKEFANYCLAMAKPEINSSAFNIY